MVHPTHSPQAPRTQIPAESWNDIEAAMLKTISFTVGMYIGAMIPEQDRHDCEQELALAAFEAAQHHKPVSVSLRTYLTHIVHMRMIDLIRQRFRQCRDPRKEARISNQLSPLFAVDDQRLLTAQGESLTRRVADAIDELPKDPHQAILRGLADGHEYQELQSQLGLTRYRFDQLMITIRQHLAGHGLDSCIP